MGYETKAFIVTGTSINDTFIKDEDVWRHVCVEGYKHYHYGADGNTYTLITNPEDIVNLKYASVIACVDLCKLGSGNNVPKQPSEYYIYAENGNDIIVEDCYGDKLNQMDLDQAVEFFTLQAGYRRVDLLLAMLLQVKASFSEHENVYVLFYGH